MFDILLNKFVEQNVRYFDEQICLTNLFNNFVQQICSTNCSTICSTNFIQQISFSGFWELGTLGFSTKITKIPTQSNTPCVLGILGFRILGFGVGGNFEFEDLGVS